MLIHWRPLIQRGRVKPSGARTTFAMWSSANAIRLTFVAEMSATGLAWLAASRSCIAAAGTRHRRLARVVWQFTLALSAYDEVRLSKLLRAAA